MEDQSFNVHLQSLLNFASELQTQLSGMSVPIDHVNKLATHPILFGDFDEAHSLGACHQAAVTEMGTLLGEVRDAINFAENVTMTVANGYEQLDKDIAGGLQVAAKGVDTGGGDTGSSTDVWNQNYQSAPVADATAGGVTAGYLDQPASGGQPAVSPGAVNVSVTVNAGNAGGGIKA